MKIKISLFYYFACLSFFGCQLKYLDYANSDHNTINGNTLNLKKVSNCLNSKDIFDFTLLNNMEYSKNTKGSILFNQEYMYFQFMNNGSMVFKQMNISSEGNFLKRNFGSINNEFYCINVFEQNENTQIMKIYKLNLPEKFTETPNLRDEYINIDLNNGDNSCLYNNNVDSFIKNEINSEKTNDKDNLIHYSDYFGNLDLLQNILQRKDNKGTFNEDMNEVISRNSNVRYKLKDIHSCTIANPKEANKEYMLLIITLDLSFGIENKCLQPHCFALFDGSNIRLLHISDYVTSERCDLNLYSIIRVNSLLDKVVITCVPNINYSSNGKTEGKYIAILNLNWDDPAKNKKTYVDIPYMKEIPGLRDASFIKVKTPEKNDHNENIKLLIIKENITDKRMEISSITGNINKGFDIGRTGITTSKDFIDNIGRSLDPNSKYSDFEYMFLGNDILIQPKESEIKSLITLNEIESIPNKIK